MHLGHRELLSLSLSSVSGDTTDRERERERESLYIGVMISIDWGNPLLRYGFKIRGEGVGEEINVWGVIRCGYM